MSRDRNGSTARRIAVALLAVACGILPLYRGAVDWPLEAMAGLLAAAALAVGSEVRRADFEAPLFLVALGLGAAVALAQLVPVPPLLQRLLSPGSVDVFRGSLEPIGLYPSWRPLSLDPPETARAAARAAALAAAGAAGLLLAGSRESRERLLAALGISGAAAALAGLVAAAAGLGPLLETRLVFVNPNHFAAFLGITSWLALGFGLRQRQAERALWLAAFAVSGSGVFLTLSRGGIAAFFVGAGVFAALYGRRLLLDRGAPSAWPWLAPPAALGSALAIAAYLAMDNIGREMATVAHVSSEAKLAVWSTAVGMIRRFPFSGIGRGAFGTVFPLFRSQADPFTFTHVENQPLQLLLDLGIPAGLAVLVLLGWTWLRAARNVDLSRPEMGALAGLASLAAHDVFDFSTELVGVSLPAAMVMGLLAHGQGGVRLGVRGFRSLAVASALVLAGGLGLHRARSAERDVALLGAAPDAATAVVYSRAAASRHPADYFPHALAGIRLVQEGHCSEAMPWLGRAIWLGSMAPEPHRYAGRCLHAAGRDELAKREYRLASTLGDPRALGEAAARYTGLDDLFQIVPDTPQGLMELGAVLRERRPSDARRVFARAWEMYRDVEALAQLAGMSLAAGEAGEALELARRLRELERSNPRSFVLASLSFDRLGDADAALDELRKGVRRFPGRPEVAYPLAQRLISARHYAEARVLLAKAVPRSAAESVQARLLGAAALRGQGRIQEALAEARAAADIDPSSTSALEILSDLLAEAGRYREAIAAIEAAAGRSGALTSAYVERIAALRERQHAQERQAGGLDSQDIPR